MVHRQQKGKTHLKSKSHKEKEIQLLPTMV